MNRQLTTSAVVLILVGSSLIGQPQASAQTYSVTASATSRVTYKLIQQTPQYDLRRPEVVSGARVTLFANFLRDQPGIVLFNLDGTSTQCEVIEWKDSSVTTQLPRLGLLQPKNAEIQIVLPDGRIAKTFRVLFVAPPDIVIHEDTVPVPLPPAPACQPASYATPVQGGLMLHAAR
jgi:hypothetical protein